MGKAAADLGGMDTGAERFFIAEGGTDPSPLLRSAQDDRHKGRGTANFNHPRRGLAILNDSVKKYLGAKGCDIMKRLWP